MSLLEFDPSAHDLVAVSLHTFEKLPQVVSTQPHPGRLNCPIRFG